MRTERRRRIDERRARGRCPDAGRACVRAAHAVRTRHHHRVSRGWRRPPQRLERQYGTQRRPAHHHRRRQRLDTTRLDQRNDVTGAHGARSLGFSSAVTRWFFAFGGLPRRWHSLIADDSGPSRLLRPVAVRKCRAGRFSERKRDARANFCASENLKDL